MATKYHFTIEQGATFRTSFVWKDSDGNPIDLTGVTPKMQIRKTGGSLIVSLTSSLTLTPLQGKVDLVIGADVTSGFTFDTANYDLKLDGGPLNTSRIVEGVVTLDKQVTE
ncbi:hypothetical protein QM806_04410 [Rhodococcus sp. IEGM 1351]|uniref:hypothetical protein n=1 Tax=Rhodococcus sp. IEGM 1351 TaxID=3047089 RepID=UPI0024B8077F|nr:hypothetical protein [Rhodococcus sp. IEGM 1351]MDI9934697.1 hypothetical protein [Rhodococcus sp. IEGM 1351]